MTKFYRFFFLAAVLILGFSAQAQTDFGKQLTSKNSRSIIAHLAPSVDVKMEKKHDVYSKKQAEVILRDFFKKHPISSFKTIHQSASKNGLHFLVGELTSNNSKFKLTLKHNGKKPSEVQSISIAEQ